jgi:hypothetical protein
MSSSNNSARINFRVSDDLTVQRQGLGALLLVDALRRSLQISEQSVTPIG